MNHAYLRAFHAVAAEGGFTRAAASLNVSQPTLSSQVKALEAAYGVRLFERRGRKVIPTALGRDLLEITRRLFSLEGEAEALLSASRGLKHGHLRVGADAPYHIIGALAAFGRRYPGVRLSLVTGNSETLLRGLLEQRGLAALVRHRSMCRRSTCHVVNSGLRDLARRRPAHGPVARGPVARCPMTRGPVARCPVAQRWLIARSFGWTPAEDPVTMLCAIRPGCHTVPRARAGAPDPLARSAGTSRKVPLAAGISTAIRRLTGTDRLPTFGLRRFSGAGGPFPN